jgi:hypothetical protein
VVINIKGNSYRLRTKEGKNAINIDQKMKACGPLLTTENGTLLNDRRMPLSRDEMIKWKPENWKASGIRKLYNPEISINGNEAKVMPKVKYGNVSYAGIFTLVKKNNEWLIMRRE